MGQKLPKKSKKQLDADKAFIAKIATLSVNTGAKQSGASCAGCGKEMIHVGGMESEMHGVSVTSNVYVHPGLERSAGPDEQSFSA